jgi:elongator complex protein 1
VILQMPRGNLEGTSPRLLVLALVVKQIDRLEYAKALEFGRRHRLDLNLLVDYNPTKFLERFAEHLIDSFLATRTATVISDRLCLFITNLHIVDVWTTKYGPQLTPFLTAVRDTAADAELVGDDKVSRVCQAMMGVLLEHESSHTDALLLPYLTAAVKQSPPDFHAALSRLQQLVASSLSSTEAAARAKRAMKHLIFLTQVDLLFEEALGMYDVALVRFVAGYSERDPKEYMPFLDECDAEKDLVARQYKIDSYLQRYSKALTHLSELLQRSDITKEREEEYERQATELVTRGGLYKHALSLFTRSSSNSTVQRLHRRVLHLKGDYLVAESHFEDAGYVYLSIEAYRDAMQSFKRARAWRMALVAASRAELEPLTELKAFAYEVAQALVNQNNVSLDDVLAAASIYSDYCDDVDEAVALLVAHKQWSESVRVAMLHKRADLIETDVETGVAVALDALCDDITQRQHEYVVRWKRLTTIREQKRLFKLHGIDGSRWVDGTSPQDDAAESVASAADSALSAASSLRSVGSHNSAMRGIGNFSNKSLAAATSSHFFATQTMGSVDTAAAAAYKSKRYGGMPSRAERRRRITEGSAEEETHVAKQLRAAAPSTALLRETRDLLRALVFFGHVAKAETLQRQLSAFEATVRDEFPMPELVETATAAAQTEAETSTVHEAVAWRFPAFA